MSEATMFELEIPWGSCKFYINDFIPPLQWFGPVSKDSLLMVGYAGRLACAAAPNPGTKVCIADKIHQLTTEIGQNPGILPGKVPDFFSHSLQT